MDNLSEKLIESTTVFNGQVLKMRFDRVVLPNGREATREVVEHPGAVAVVPVTDDGKIILVRQYRYPVREVMLEIPAGKLDKGESPDRCAIRELEEETGFVAKKMTKLASFYTAPGFTDEIMHVYLAQQLEQSEQNLDADEFLTVDFYSPQQVREMVAQNVIKDAKTIAGLLLAGY